MIFPKNLLVTVELTVEVKVADNVDEADADTVLLTVVVTELVMVVVSLHASSDVRLVKNFELLLSESTAVSSECNVHTTGLEMGSCVNATHSGSFAQSVAHVSKLPPTDPMFRRDVAVPALPIIGSLKLYIAPASHT